MKMKINLLLGVQIKTKIRTKSISKNINKIKSRFTSHLRAVLVFDSQHP